MHKVTDTMNTKFAPNITLQRMSYGTPVLFKIRPKRYEKTTPIMTNSWVNTPKLPINYLGLSSLI